MRKNADQYLRALKRLRKQWESCIDFHAYLHEGEEHEHDLETDLIRLEKSIIAIYGQHHIRKIGRYTKKDMLSEVHKVRATPPRQYVNTPLSVWNQIPHHPVRRELELVITDMEARMSVSARAPRLRIREDAMEAILGDKHIPLTEAEFRILKKLKEKSGKWVGGKHLKSTPDSEERPDRTIKGLKEKLGKRIESGRLGYRLT